MEQKECLSERLSNLFLSPFYRSWVWHSPMCGHRLCRPYWTGLFCSTVAHRENEIELRGVGLRKFLPTFASEPFGSHVGRFELSHRFRSNCARRMAPSTVGTEPNSSLRIHNAFRHDRTGRVTSAEKQYVVMIFHVSRNTSDHSTPSVAA